MMPDGKTPQSGVAAKEYGDVLHKHLVPQGNQLFAQSAKWKDSWQLQQDNAPCHKAKEIMAYIKLKVPGGHFLPWPAHSPDLSPIENLWAWMDRQLHKMHTPKNVDELKESLESVRQSIPLTMIHNLFDGMPARMEAVIARNGEHIGK